MTNEQGDNLLELLKRIHLALDGIGLGRWDPNNSRPAALEKLTHELADLRSSVSDDLGKIADEIPRHVDLVPTLQMISHDLCCLKGSLESIDDKIGIALDRYLETNRLPSTRGPGKP